MLVEGGGELERIPWILRYEVGASFVERLVREVGSPAAVLALFCPGVREYLGYPTDAAPAAVLRDITGLTWEGFLGRWRTELLGLRVTPAGELIHRFYMRNVELRAAFLRPLLAPDARRELERLRERVVAGRGTEADLARAEAILGDAWAEPTPGILDAIRARMEPLRRLAREISGSEGMLAVYELSIALATGKCAPEECVRAFVALVNRYPVGTSTCPRAGEVVIRDALPEAAYVMNITVTLPPSRRPRWVPQEYAAFLKSSFPLENNPEGGGI
ncbi:hypothetical protein ACVNPS_02110 [Candidatus Bipolaricaulota sp. J31]